MRDDEVGDAGLARVAQVDLCLLVEKKPSGERVHGGERERDATQHRRARRQPVDRVAVRRMKGRGEGDAAGPCRVAEVDG
jgi:hypothetical protein